MFTGLLVYPQKKLEELPHATSRKAVKKLLPQSVDPRVGRPPEVNWHTCILLTVYTVTANYRGCMAGIAYSDGVMTSQYRYNELLQPVSIANNSPMQLDYNYDRQGNVRRLSKY